MKGNYSLLVTRYSLRPAYAWALVAVLAAAVVALFLSFQAGLFVLFFAAMAWWAWKHPEESLWLLLLLLPFLPMLKITQTVALSTLLKDVLIITLFMKTFFLPLATKQLPFRRILIFAPLLALCIWVAWGVLRADSLILGILRARDIGLYVLLFFGILYLPAGRRVWHKRAGWFLAGVGVSLLLGVYQWFFAFDSAVLRFDPVREIWIPRLSSTLAHPSIFGQYLVAAATLCAAIVFFHPSRRVKWLIGALGTTMLPFIFLTYSRAVWIGLVAAGAAMLVAYAFSLVRAKLPRKLFWRYAIGAAAVAIIIFAGMIRFTPAGTFLRSAFDPTYASNEERLTFLVRLIAPLSNTEAIVGKGLGDVLAQNFREIDLEAIDIAEGSAAAVQTAKNRTLVDNQYLKSFVELGVIGLLIYAWLYWRLLRSSLQLLARNQKLEIGNQIIGLWAIGFLAAFLIQAFFIDIWDIFPTNALFWVVAALVAAASTPSIEKNVTTS